MKTDQAMEQQNGNIIGERGIMRRWISSIAWGALLGGAAFAQPVISVVLMGVDTLSTADAVVDTLVVNAYVGNDGTTYANTTLSPVLICDMLANNLSLKQHFLAPGDSIAGGSGSNITDTVVVAKAAFAFVLWSDPLHAFGASLSSSPPVVRSRYLDFHPEHDTTFLPGCPPLPVARLRSPLVGGAITEVYNIAGRRVWKGRLPAGALPSERLQPGTYLRIQGSERRVFHVLANL